MQVRPVRIFNTTMSPAQPSPSIPKRRRWRQFSLRSLLVFFLVIALLLGWVSDQRRRVLREQQAVEAIYACGGYVMYEHDSAIFHRDDPPGPAWLKWVLGEYFFTRLDLVFLPPGLQDV